MTNFVAEEHFVFLCQLKDNKYLKNELNLPVGSGGINVDSAGHKKEQAMET
jgi:hypothetical protein